MKTALITTTINVPKVLALYRKLGPDVKFFIALDKKSADLGPWIAELSERGAGDSNAIIFSPEGQTNWKCSDSIGWNTVRRRNIALLEALKWGANEIVTIDDDNIPFDTWYFPSMRRILRNPELFHGLKVSSPTKWFDAGQLMIPQTPHRGFPYDKKAQPSYEPVTDIRIGVAAGLCLGDPDIDAVTRIATSPIVHGVSELARAGVVTDPNETWTVFNTQNTAFIRELAPAMFCAPGLGRFDDIVASLITQRVMRSRGLHVHFGQPFVWQQRNSHNLVHDLEEEVWGMKYLTLIAEALDGLAAHSGWSVAEHCRDIWQDFDHAAYMPKEACAAALAFLDDCETVL